MSKLCDTDKGNEGQRYISQIVAGAEAKVSRFLVNPNKHGPF